MNLQTMLNTSEFGFGTWLQTGSPEIFEILGYSGKFDFVVIDTEHGYYGLETAENLVRAANASGISSLVRVTTNEPYLIMKALDIGAEGVLVPQITSKRDAEKAVSAARYYPKGNRGACPFVRAGKHLVTDWGQYAAKANEDTVVMILIEGEAGMTNMEEIIQTEGLNAIMMGPFDLSVSLGVGGQLNHPKVTTFIRDAIELCNKQNIHLILPNFDYQLDQAGEAVANWRQLGCKFFTIGSDKLFLVNQINQVNAVLRGK